MDQRLRYEQLIAGKLESLPLPDMQDAIWARVKAQLDLDLPEDDGGGDAPQSPSGPGIIGWGLSVVLVALITVFFISKNKTAGKEDSSPTTIVQPANTTLPAESPPGVTDPARGNNSPKNNAVPQTAAGTTDSAQQDLVDISATPQDSVFTKTDVPLITAVQPRQDTSAPVKKGKGMKLNEEDYRIVPKKEN